MKIKSDKKVGLIVTYEEIFHIQKALRLLSDYCDDFSPEDIDGINLEMVSELDLQLEPYAERAR